MKRLVLWTLLLVAALAPAALPAAEPAAADPAAGLFCAAAAPAVEASAGEDAGLPAELTQPEPKVFCEIGCVNEQYCRRDSDCTAAPGGRCNLICPRNGCCVY